MTDPGSRRYQAADLEPYVLLILPRCLAHLLQPLCPGQIPVGSKSPQGLQQLSSRPSLILKDTKAREGCYPYCCSGRYRPCVSYTHTEQGPRLADHGLHPGWPALTFHLPPAASAEGPPVLSSCWLQDSACPSPFGPVIRPAHLTASSTTILAHLELHVL